MPVFASLARVATVRTHGRGDLRATVGDPLLSHTLFPCYVGALLWTGLYLRDPRVRRLIAVG